MFLQSSNLCSEHTLTPFCSPFQTTGTLQMPCSQKIYIYIYSFGIDSHWKISRGFTIAPSAICEERRKLCSFPFQIGALPYSWIIIDWTCSLCNTLDADQNKSLINVIQDLSYWGPKKPQTKSWDQVWEIKDLCGCVCVWCVYACV